MSDNWKPHVVVAAIVEQDGKYLLVEERTDDGILFNQPAGHLDEGESLVDAVIRECFEETAHHFEPEALIGIYRWRHPKRHNRTYLRFAFSGVITGFDPTAPLDKGILRAVWMTPEEIRATSHTAPLDKGILRAVWMTPEEIRATSHRHRSPLLIHCMEDHLAGKSHPLELLTDYADEA